MRLTGRRILVLEWGCIFIFWASEVWVWSLGVPLIPRIHRMCIDLQPRIPKGQVQPLTSL